MLKRIEENIDNHFIEYNKICQEIYESLEVYIKTILTTYNIKELLFSHNNRFVINLYYEYIDEYINLSHTITDNMNEMERRWRSGSAFYWYQMPPVYSEFMSSDYEEAMMQSRKKGLQRYVDVEWIRPLSRGLWQAQFKTYSIFPNKAEPDIRYWRAVMRIKYVNLQFQDRAKRALNPYGFLIESYSVAYHGDKG